LFYCVIVCLPTTLCFYKMSLESVQYRSIVRFSYLKGKSRDEIQVEFNDVYGEQSQSLPKIKRWFNEFKAGKHPCGHGKVQKTLWNQWKNNVKAGGNHSRWKKNHDQKIQCLNISKGTLKTLLATLESGNCVHALYLVF